MGSTLYCSATRSARADTLGYSTKSINQIFTQTTERKAHESMSSVGLTVREARDSDVHPKTIPVILGLDVTGSMGQIPHMLIKDGLPKIMSSFIQKGLNDIALQFCAVGDHEYDRHPLQVGQFESGDEELDMWLTRTYIEGGGGRNNGESYQLAWLNALEYTVTDAWEKRGEKGVLITIGDEPVLEKISPSALKEVFGDTYVTQNTIETKELLKQVQEKWDVYHIHINSGSGMGRNYDAGVQWKELLGQNCIPTQDYEKIPDLIIDTIIPLKSFDKDLDEAGLLFDPKVDVCESECKPETSHENIEILA